MNALGGLTSLLTLLGVVLVMNINNSVAVGMLTLRARSSRHGFRMRLGGLLASLVVRWAMVMVLAAALRPEFRGLLGLHVNPTVQRVLCLVAGVFLLGNAGVEVKRRLRPAAPADESVGAFGPPLGLVCGMALVTLADLSLSFDSLIAVAGMAAHPAVMPAIVVVEVAVILFFSEAVARLLKRYPTIETLAICALLLMGGVMILRAAGLALPDTVVYAMIGFALLVELIDMRIASVSKRETRTNDQR
jgi:predicted tellurium resistance membrane protein TerC